MISLLFDSCMHKHNRDRERKMERETEMERERKKKFRKDGKKKKSTERELSFIMCKHLSLRLINQSFSKCEVRMLRSH